MSGAAVVALFFAPSIDTPNRHSEITIFTIAAALERFRPHSPELSIEASTTILDALIDEVEHFNPTSDVGNEPSW